MNAPKISTRQSAAATSYLSGANHSHVGLCKAGVRKHWKRLSARSIRADQKKRIHQEMEAEVLSNLRELEDELRQVWSLNDQDWDQISKFWGEFDLSDKCPTVDDMEHMDDLRRQEECSYADAKMLEDAIRSFRKRHHIR